MSDRFSKKDKEILYARSGGRCELCGKVLPKDWHADHVVAKSRGGPTDLLNGSAKCPKCNQVKGARSLDEMTLGELANLFSMTIEELVDFLSFS